MDRAKRVRFLKRAIITVLLAFIVCPTILCVILFFRISRLGNEIASLKEIQAADEAKIDELQTSLQDQLEKQQQRLDELAFATENAEPAPEPEEENVSEDPVTFPKKVYLTFDDGPSGHTQDILDILDSYGVKGNFFVCATQNDDYLKYYQMILDQGHMLGIHSYSHKYEEIYASMDAFEEDVLAIRSFVAQQTGGYEAVYYRFPGGSSNLHSRISISACEDWLKEQGLIYYDWNISSQDATNPMQPVENVFHNATYGCENYEEVVVLMHDLGNKDSTVAALPQIIEYYQGIGVQISVIDENSMRIQHDK